jgi:cytochrome P450
MVPSLSFANVLFLTRTTGDVLSFHILGQVIVVLNTVKATRDLFDKRGAIYSDRPVMPFYDMCVLASSIVGCMLTSIRMGWNWVLTFARSGDHWRQGRRMIDRGLRPVATASYRPIIQAKTLALLSRLLENPQQWNAHTELSVVILSELHQATELYGECSAFRGS